MCRQIRREEVNFFDNDFSEDVGNALFGNDVCHEKFNFSSPDNTSDGWLKKRWKIVDGVRYLVKAGSGTEKQEPINEAFIASELLSSLGARSSVTKHWASARESAVGVYFWMM